MKFKLWVGGMESVDKLSALQMMMTDEEDKEFLPRFPKILYALDIPLIWFWGDYYQEGEEPELPHALNADYFSIVYDYTIKEVVNILSLL